MLSLRCVSTTADHVLLQVPCLDNIFLELSHLHLVGVHGKQDTSASITFNLDVSRVNLRVSVTQKGVVRLPVAVSLV
jgi:hypothetical protein